MKKFLITTILVLAMMLPGISQATDLWDTGDDQVNTERATGAAGLAETLAPSVPFQLLEIRVHLGSASATSENLTITMDAKAGAAYDTVLYSVDMDTVADLVVTFEHRYFSNADEIDIAWTNTNTETYGLEIVYKTLN